MAPRVKGYDPVYATFLVYKARPEWYTLTPGERTAAAEDVERVLAASPARRRGLYSLVGFRQDADLMLWATAADLDTLQQLPAGLAATVFPRLFDTVGVYPAIAKASPYTGSHVPAFLRGVAPQRYVIMYPFVKTPQWYLLPFEERRRMMEDHGRIGGQWPQVFTNTLYAFGLGDYEFVTAFETQVPADFLALVERLRSSEVRLYTQRDTPIYLGARKPFWQAFADLGVPLERTTLVLTEAPETVRALREGHRVVVLRRGGTKENAFGLPGDLILVAPPGAEAVDLAARVEATTDLTEETHLEHLQTLLPGLLDEARARFLWRRPGQALRAVVLRALAVSRAALPAAVEAFGEWTELRTGVPVSGARQVSDEDALEHAVEVVRNASADRVVPV